MKKTMLILACLSLLFFGCLNDKKGDAGKIIPSPGVEGQKTENIDRFMREGPAFPVGATLAEISKNLGSPLKKTVEERQNVHNKNQTDAIYKLFYGGLYLEVYHVTDLNRDLVLLLEVTGDRYPVALGLGVGAKKEKVRSVLGRPNEEKPEQWRYFASDLVMGAIEFGFQNESVSSIRWYYSVD
jgi:hypothetical protein